MNEFKISKLNYNFRIKKMNAIQLLALRSQLDFDDYNKTQKTYEIILSNIEVEVNGSWLPVREELKFGQVDYYPAGIEDDVISIQEIIRYFIKNYLTPVFTKSNESN